MESPKVKIDSTQYYQWSTTYPSKAELAAVPPPPVYTHPNQSINQSIKPSDKAKQEGEKTGKNYCYGRTIYWCGLIICVAMAITLICLGVFKVKPYVYSLQFGESACEVVFANYTGDKIRCSCGKYCGSDYPCVKLTVTLTNISAGVGHSGPGNYIFYDTEYDLADGRVSSYNTCILIS